MDIIRVNLIHQGQVIECSPIKISHQSTLWELRAKISEEIGETAEHVKLKRKDEEVFPDDWNGVMLGMHPVGIKDNDALHIELPIAGYTSPGETRNLSNTLNVELDKLEISSDEQKTSSYKLGTSSATLNESLGASIKAGYHHKAEPSSQGMKVQVSNVSTSMSTEDGTELQDQQKTAKENSETSSGATNEIFNKNVKSSKDDEQQVSSGSQHIPLDFCGFHETVEVQKGTSTHFLKCNASFKLPDDSAYEAISFDGSFLSEGQTKQKISSLMETHGIIPCGPWIHLENLKSGNEPIDDEYFEGSLSIRHYLHLQSQDKLLLKQGKEKCPSKDEEQGEEKCPSKDEEQEAEKCPSKDEEYFFVSFDANTGKIDKHECKELKAHYGTVAIHTFSYWCIAAEKCLKKPCCHRFKMDLYLMRPKLSDCPHIDTYLYIVASGDDWKEADETKENLLKWSKIENLKGMFFQKIKDEGKEEPCAKEIQMSIFGCSNKYDILLRPTLESKNEWETLETDFSMEKFVHNQRLGVYTVHIEGAFPAGGCENVKKANSANCSRIKFESKSTSEVKGYPDKLYKDNGLKITIFDCKLKDDRRGMKRTLSENDEVSGTSKDRQEMSSPRNGRGMETRRQRQLREKAEGMPDFDRMKEIIIEEIRKSPQICSDELFARNLGLQVDFRNWASNPFNMKKSKELKVDYILETWKQHRGLDATPETMFKILDELSKKDASYNLVTDRLGLEFNL